MTKGQYTVLVLLLALLGLEILRSSNVRAFFKGLIPGLGTTASGSVTGAGGSNAVNTGGVTVTNRRQTGGGGQGNF